MNIIRYTAWNKWLNEPIEPFLTFISTARSAKPDKIIDSEHKYYIRSNICWPVTWMIWLIFVINVVKFYSSFPYIVAHLQTAYKTFELTHQLDIHV